MFDLTDSDRAYLFGKCARRRPLVRRDNTLVIAERDGKPFYVTSKKNWCKFLEQGVKIESDFEGRKKYLDNAAFILSSIDFDLTLLFESLNDDNTSLLSPAVLNGLQQAIIIGAQSVLEGVGQYYFLGNNLEKRKGIKYWQVGVCHLVGCPVPKEVKNSDFELLSKARNRVHQDQLENRTKDYFARMDSRDLCIPIAALQKVLVCIWKNLPLNPQGKPQRRFQNSLLSCADLVERANQYAQSRKKNHDDYHFYLMIESLGTTSWEVDENPHF